MMIIIIINTTVIIIIPQEDVYKRQVGAQTLRTVFDMDIPEPTGVVFLVNVNTSPGEPNLLFNQSSIVAVRYVRQRREFLITSDRVRPVSYTHLQTTQQPE